MRARSGPRISAENFVKQDKSRRIRPRRGDRIAKPRIAAANQGGLGVAQHRGQLSRGLTCVHRNSDKSFRDNRQIERSPPDAVRSDQRAAVSLRKPRSAQEAARGGDPERACVAQLQPRDRPVQDPAELGRVQVRLDRPAMQDAMRNRGKGVVPDQPSGGLTMHPGAGTGGVQILSPTNGVDFSSWLARWHYVTQRTWDPLIPDEVNPPILKRGQCEIIFTILPNGRLQAHAMQLTGRSGDVALDRANILSAIPWAGSRRWGVR